MPKPSDPRREVLTGLLGLGLQSSRKSYYPELMGRLEELETERNRYKWLFENAVHGIFQGDMEHGIRAANPSLVRMLGYPSTEAVLAAATELKDSFFAAGAEEFRRVGEQLRLQGELVGYETRLRRLDGSELDVRMNLLLKQEGGRSLVEGFVADISGRKQAERAMQLLNEQLEQRVHERTQELETLNDSLRHEIIERERVQWALRDARDAAELANRNKDHYLAAVSHDLLQPLNAARLLMATLRERALPAAEAQLVERSHAALESAEDMLSDLLDIARLDHGNIPLDLGNHSLAEVIDPLLSEFQGLIETSGLQVRARLGRWAVRTDYRMLSRILRNLLSNAIRYTPSGRILIGCRRRGELLSIQVWDTGLGIPRERFEDIFREFNQLHADRVGPRKGAGLGLAIVERIARLLEAPLQVHSVVGQGSMFSVTLPLARASTPNPPDALLERLSAPLQGRHLLVIDNDAMILSSMQGLLEQWGARVQVAVDLPGALAVLDGRRPDAILVDYHLDAGQTGCDAVGVLREHFHWQIPAIMITADRSEHSRQRLRDLGIPVLNKPIKAGKLRAMLGQVL
ncbi:PAS domain-containing hybrid sensor histidine kinase/response regulator [Halopseudomonas xiamenensis]|uniref:PAS domain-containing hybrid sensor histidine kinase/response regulator n=1 Tax=Halopseudomonas xiamenensis TaxID=157792 RepID=UPI001624F06A|nr:ATP-binding protein [Halopseudomonas xiamenensis]